MIDSTQFAENLIQDLSENLQLIHIAQFFSQFIQRLIFYPLF